MGLAPVHELGIALNLAEAAGESARKAGLARVDSVRVAVGVLSGVDPDALASAWEITRDRPGCETAALACDVIPVTIYCHRCQEAVRPEACWRLVCPVCQTPSRDVRAGRELLLVQLEGE